MHIKMRLLRTGNKKKILKAVRETRYKHRNKVNDRSSVNQSI